jgi:hypothetical protein
MSEFPAELVDNLTAILGISANEASYFLGMVGGDLESAISMYYEMGTSGGGGDFGSVGDTTSGQSSKKEYPPWYTTVWPEKKQIHEAWLEQGINFSIREVQCKN